jgi:hypothetical protein
MFLQPPLHLRLPMHWMSIYNPKQFAASVGHQPLTKLNELIRYQLAQVQHESNPTPIADAGNVVDSLSLALTGANL